jgi:transcriptional regulator with XRE-family HTH domain
VTQAADETPTKTVATRVRQYRTERGWSARVLAEKCQEAGLKWERDVVANLESGRRTTVTLDELLILALVLNVPPILLMTPLGTQDEQQVTPQVRAAPWDVYRWFMGEIVDPRGDGFATPEVMSNWSKAHEPIRLYHKFYKTLDDLRHTPDDDATSGRVAVLVATLAVNEVRDEMARAGVLAPQARDEFETELKRLLKRQDEATESGEVDGE